MVDNFDPHLSCDRLSKAEDLPGYVTKEISLDSSIGRTKHLVTPLKSLDLNGINRTTASLFSSIPEMKILESPVFIWDQRTWRTINDINEGIINDTSRFLSMLKLRPKVYDTIRNSYVVPSIVFSRHPFKERIHATYQKGKPYRIKKYPPLDKDNFVTFLDNIYSYSRGMILVPDIKISSIPTIGPTIKPDEYVKTISYFTEIFSYKNNFPIFVPIQPGISNKATHEIITSYKKMGYSNIWINFNAGEVYGRNLSGLRQILRELDKTFGEDNYLVYYSHIKKEISPNMKDTKAPASDLLSQFFNGDIIGANKEPTRPGGMEPDADFYVKKGFRDKTEYQRALRLHKGRIFDPDSYYYYTVPEYPQPSLRGFSQNDLINNKEKNIALDNLIKFKEVENVKKIFGERNRIKTYVKDKPMFVEHKNIFNEITTSKDPTRYRPLDRNLFDFL